MGVSAFVVVVLTSTIWLGGNGDGEDASPGPTNTPSTTHATTTTAPRVATSAPPSPDLQLEYGLRRNWMPLIGVTWSGLPDTVAYVTVATYDGATNPRPREVVDGTAAFEMPKPDWTRYTTFTAHAEDGTPLLVEERLVDGRSCSAGRLNPNPVPHRDLPEAVDEARVYLFERAVACRYADIARAATGEGPFFGVSPDDLASELQELDRRRGIMAQIRGALLLTGSEEERNGRVVYVFTGGEVELVIDADGRFVEAATQQAA